MITVSNALRQYYAEIQRSGDLCRENSNGAGEMKSFQPDFALPELDDKLELFFSASTIRLTRLTEYRGRSIRLLDLTCNPRTRTTKTFPSLVMVARAVRHIQTTGEPVMLLTPTSANKGGALRDAVLRAVECGLVEPHQLRIAIVVPQQGVPKLWSSPLSTTPHLRALNPVLVAKASDGRVVKELARAFLDQHADALRKSSGTRIWHTYDIENYRMADAVRAFVEAEHLGIPAPGVPRVHAQAVSSAFGLLGYDHGRRVLTESMAADCGPDPRWLLVQHLGTPDLVLHGLFGTFDRENLPKYRVDDSSGLLVQAEAPSFPSATLALDEVIDSTFYSNRPATVGLVEASQQRGGGGGIVVSLAECLDRYPYLRNLLCEEGPVLPADPRTLREWAMVMVLTGVLNAIDRDLVPSNAEIVVHGTGSYTDSDYTPISMQHTVAVTNVGDMLEAIAPRRADDPKDSAVARPIVA